MKQQVYIRLFIFSLLSIVTSFLYGQSDNDNSFSSKFALKTNALYWASTTLNLGVEYRLSEKVSLDLSGNYNPWSFSNNRKLKHWLVQPEARYWLKESSGGHFAGIHFHVAGFNVGGVKMLGLEKYRYQGNLFGGGLTYGYRWALNSKWSIEGAIGIGYAHIDYTKYNCQKCGSEIEDGKYNYWGPTKAGMSFIYLIE